MDLKYKNNNFFFYFLLDIIKIRILINYYFKVIIYDNYSIKKKKKIL